MRLESLVREGTLADAQNLATLGAQVFLHTYATDGVSSALSHYVLHEFTAERFSAQMASPTSLVLVSELNTHLVGYAVVTVQTPCPQRTSCTAELATLYVQEHFTRQAIGSALLARAQAYAAEHTKAPLWLTVNAKNQLALGFYAKRSYRTIGVTQFPLGGKHHENHVLIGPDT